MKPFDLVNKSSFKRQSLTSTDYGTQCAEQELIKVGSI
jgi:hypothetical protein